jgi:hypothetical protein
VKICDECNDAPASSQAWFNGRTLIDLCVECATWWEANGLIEPKAQPVEGGDFSPTTQHKERPIMSEQTDVNTRQTDANTRQTDANTLRQLAETARVLTDIGFDKHSAIDAVTSFDLAKLLSDDA